MNFHTANDGHVYNDDKKPSGSHHGSVRPETGIKQKQEYKKIKVWSWANASKELREKILEKQRQMIAEHDDGFYAQDDGIMYLKQKGGDIVGYEIFKGNMPKYWAVDNSGNDYIQFNLEIKDKEKFKKAFGIPESLWNKIEVRFENPREANTKIEFIDAKTYEPIEEGHDYNHENLSKSELGYLDEAREKFDSLVNASLSNLRSNYENQFTEESIVENIKANGYKFDEYGKLA